MGPLKLRTNKCTRFRRVQERSGLLIKKIGKGECVSGMGLPLPTCMCVPFLFTFQWWPWCVPWPLHKFNSPHHLISPTCHMLLSWVVSPQITFTLTIRGKQDHRGTVKTCPPSEKIETSHACASLPPLSNGPDGVKIWHSCNPESLSEAFYPWGSPKMGMVPTNAWLRTSWPCNLPSTIPILMGL